VEAVIFAKLLWQLVWIKHSTDTSLYLFTWQLSAHFFLSTHIVGFAGIVAHTTSRSVNAITPKANCFTGYVASNLSIEITVPTLSDPVVVMSVFDWIIIHQHLGKDFDWNRTWDEYKAGFGSIDGNFWLGLEKMHLLTQSQPYRLRV